MADLLVESLRDSAERAEARADNFARAERWWLNGTPSRDYTLREIRENGARAEGEARAYRDAAGRAESGDGF